MKTSTYTKKDFNWVKWTPEDIKRASRDIIKTKKERYTKIKKIPAAERTFENTIYALEASDYDLSDKMTQIHVLGQTSTSRAVRDAAHAAETYLSHQLIGIEYDEKIYQAVKEYAAKKEQLTGPDKKLLHDMLLGYKRMGFELSPAKRKELQVKIKRSSKLSQQFSRNINEYNDFILVTREELEGLPQAYVQGLKKDKKTGKYKVTLDYPDIGPFLVKAKNAEKRAELFEKNLRKGGKKNMQILAEILTLRKERAKLLGYKTHADYATEVRTVKTTKRALSFVNSLLTKVQKGVSAELKELTELKQEQTKDPRAKLTFADIGYYSDQLAQKKFSIDSEKVREYFPAEVVKEGTFKIYQTLFSVKFKKLSGYPLWHKDVELYAVEDKGKVISYFALDLHPREGKYGHACAIDLVNGRQVPGKDQYVAPIAVMLANFPNPRKGHPSLLSHGEVRTFFHEFGHVMHMVLTRAKYSSQAGANTAWDFVEAPSQMLEHWIWDKKMLNILSSHYKTKEDLPKAMLDNMLKGKNHLVSYSVARQLIFALFDLKLHTEHVKNPERLYGELLKKYAGTTLPKTQLFPAGFDHLMGYDAGYYGYMWSKVFGDDMATRFKKEGFLNKKVGADYRRWILEKGSSEDEMKLVEKFLKRKSNNEAFLEEIGLKK